MGTPARFINVTVCIGPALGDCCRNLRPSGRPRAAALHRGIAMFSRYASQPPGSSVSLRVGWATLKMKLYPAHSHVPIYHESNLRSPVVGSGTSHRSLWPSCQWVDRGASKLPRP